MAKDKKGSKAAVAPAISKPLESVKAGRVTKAAEQTKKSAKEGVAKAAKAVEKSAKKVKKAATPESSDDETSDSSASSDEEVGRKVNGKTNGAAADSSDSDSDSDSSDSDSDEEVPAKTNGKVNGKAAADSSDSEDDSDSGSSDSDSDEAPAKKTKAAPVADKKMKDADSSSESGSDSESDEEEAKAGAKDDDDSSDASSSDSDSEEGAPKKAAEAPKKRKADETPDQAAKKSKVENSNNPEGIANLFVGNLSWNVDEDWLTREFEEYGEIKGCRVITDRDSGRSKGFGYVEFTDPDHAAAALEAKHGAFVDGRDLRVDFSAPRPPRDANQTPQQKSFDRAAKYGDTPREPAKTLFVGNISFDADEDMVTQMFQEYGTITGVRLPTDRESGQPKGYGYVDFTSVEEATAAFDALQGATLANRPIRLDYSQPRSNDSPAGGRGGRGGFGDRGGRGRGGFGDRGGRGRGGFGDRGGRGRGAPRGRGMSTNRGGFGDFSGNKKSFD